MRGEGVKKRQNSVPVVIECPLSTNNFENGTSSLEQAFGTYLTVQTVSYSSTTAEHTYNVSDEW
jgi:hypothetical protein